MASKEDLLEALHRHFRGANEVAKMCKGAGNFLDLSAGVIATFQIFGNMQFNWMPLVLLGGAIVSAALRGYSRHVRSFSHQCRKLSFRAFCLNLPLDPLIVSNAEIQSPPLSRWFAKRLPAQTMNDYYEPTKPPGEGRLLELSAHSAFYTWRLTHYYSWICILLASLVFIYAFVAIYSMAVGGEESNSTYKVIEALCSFALVQLCIRFTEAAFEAHASAQEAKRIEEELTKKPHGNELLRLVDAYEIERSGGIDPPTILYSLMRDGLQQQWFLRRKTFS